MASTLLHRGPDDAGVWVDAAAGIALAHRRLSILDLSPAGHQTDGVAQRAIRHCIQREIYNFPELRDQLKEEPEDVSACGVTPIRKCFCWRSNIGGLSPL